ncbi:Uncharacterised protein [Streptococcus pneumoniae]|nr:Uncharacterised protein [Streptococcus pneumoniae]
MDDPFFGRICTGFDSKLATSAQEEGFTAKGAGAR